MNTAGRIWAMPRSDRGLLARALLVVLAFRAALYIAPPSRIRRLAARPVDHSASLAGFSPERLAWAVRAAARVIPAATCLTQALSLYWLLAKGGHPAEVRVGVAKGADGGIDSHAWVVCHGRVLVGGCESLERYVPILSLGAEQS